MGGFIAERLAAAEASLASFYGSREFWWLLVGFGGQALFMMRFLVQWIASEKAGKSVMPEIFWYFSIGGGLVLLAYAVHKQDPVFIFGQALGTFIYLRNIYFVRREKRRLRETT